MTDLRTSAPTPDGAATYPAAELDHRFYAFVVDRLVAWGLFAGAAYLSWRFFLDDGRVMAGIAAILATVVVVSLVFATLLGLAGISPGKALVGLRVVRFDDGRPIGLVKALVRTAALGLFTLPTLGLGLATLAWTAVMDPGGRRRGGHDQMSDSVVVDVRPAAATEVEDARPRAVVNLTAMRLVPTPAPEAPVPVPARLAPPVGPVGPVGPPPPAAPSTAQTSLPVPAPAPVAPPPLPPPLPAAPAVTDVEVSGPTVRRPVPTPSAARWRVTFDTGETFVVAGLALVGRRPEARAGEPVAHLVPLRSSDMSLSKTHAQFQVVPDGALVVMDRGSTNGSTILRQGVSKPLTAGRPATLLDGDTVRFGDRSMVVLKDPAR